MFALMNLVAKFRKEEDGLALTEYLVLLGLLVAGVIAAVVAFGQGLSGAWEAWAGWINTALRDTPSLS